MGWILFAANVYSVSGDLHEGNYGGTPRCSGEYILDHHNYLFAEKSIMEMDGCAVGVFFPLQCTDCR
jgi:hypothetical protein